MRIGGNLYATLQVKNSQNKNRIGERVPNWQNCMTILGWLDLQSGEAKHSTFNAKIQESTHVFICDYTDLSDISVGQETVDLTSNNARMIIKNMAYEIKLIDNPMGLNKQLEIYLKFIGVQ